MERAKTTRLRWVSSKDANNLSLWLDKLGTRVQIYGAPQWNGKQWFLWYVPNDFGADIKSIDLDSL